MNSGYLRGVIFIVMAALFWSSAGLMIKLAEIGPLQIAFYRSLIAGIFLLVVLEWWRRHRRIPFRYTVNRASLQTAFFYTGTVTLFVIANKLTTAANAVFLQYMAPAYVILISYFFLKEKIYFHEIVTVLLCLSGMGLFFIESEKSSAFLGNVSGILAGVMFALLQISVKHSIPSFRKTLSIGDKHAHSEMESLYQLIQGNLMTVVLIGVLILGLSSGTDYTLLSADGITQAFRMSMTDMFVMLFLGIVQLGMGYICFAKGVHYISSVEVSIYTLIEPVSNPLWTYLGTGEKPGFWALTGGVLVLVSAVWNSVVHHRKKKNGSAS